MSQAQFNRVASCVLAAQRANKLAVRFARKGDEFNANNARVIAVLAIRQARAIAQTI